MTLCLYAIVAARTERLRSRGMRAERLSVHRMGRIAAVVGEMRGRPAASSQNLRRYHDVVRALSEEVDAILPVRFGTFLDTAGELDMILQLRAASFVHMLAGVRRRVQMTVRIVGHQYDHTTGRHHSEPGNADATSAPKADRSSGVTYLKSRAAGHSALPPEGVVIRQRVRRWIRAEWVERHGSVTSLYHLIPRAASDAYARAIDATDLDAGVHVSGPFPPFAFADPLGAIVARPVARGRVRSAFAKAPTDKGKRRRG